jgi:putative acetyltransferase
MSPPTVRPETDDDVDGVRRLVAAAYGGERVRELLDALRESVAWLDLAFVAEQDGGVVGQVTYTRGWLDTPTKLVEVLVLSPLAVRPEEQRRGVGTALVRESLAAVEDRHEPLVFLEGDPGYYSRLGFVPGAHLHMTPPSIRIPEAAFQVASLPGYDPSWMRGALVYPDVFWRQDCVGLRPEGGRRVP